MGIVRVVKLIGKNLVKKSVNLAISHPQATVTIGFGALWIVLVSREYGKLMEAKRQREENALRTTSIVEELKSPSSSSCSSSSDEE